MTNPERPTAAYDTSEPGTGGSRRSLASLGQLGLILLVVAGLAIAFYHDRHILVRTFSELSLQTIVLSTLLVTAGNVFTYASWRSLLTRIGIPLPWGDGFRTFFTTQLGKYVPGSVWPTVMQTAAIRRRGGSRGAAVTANIMAVVIGCVTGVGAAALTLPFVSGGAVKRYWWTLALLPVLVCALHPRAVGIGERALRWVSRRSIELRPVAAGGMLRSAGWSIGAWVLYGVALAVLVQATRPLGVATLIACIGGIGLAVSAGILAVPLPSGLGIRETVMVVALSSQMPAGQAEAMAFASRATFLVADLLLGGIAGMQIIYQQRRDISRGVVG